MLPDRMLAVALACALVAGCADEIREDVGAIRDAAPDSAVAGTPQQGGGGPPLDGARTYRCTDLEFTVRFEGSIAHVQLPDRTIQLPESPGAAVPQYTDGQSTLRVQDTYASIELPEGSWHDCEEVLPPVDGGTGGAP